MAACLLLLTVALTLALQPLTAAAQDDLPERPTGLAVSAASHDAVTIAWDNPDDSSITGYQILRRSRDGDDYGDGQGAAEFVVIVNDTGSAATSYTDTSVTPRTRYVYRVKAINSAGLSEWSSYGNAETPEEPPAPAAQPTGLTVSAATHEAITITWDDPGDDSITGYRILRRSRDGDGQGPAGFAVIAEDTGSAATTYTDDTVTPRTRYAYRVEAVNAQGSSPSSGGVNAETPAEPTPPAQPTGLTASAVSHDSVTLAWDDPEDDTITGYRILRRSRDGDEYGDGQGPAGFSVIAQDTGSAATSYTDTSVSPHTRYVYRVQAVNDNGVSERSSYVNVETPEEPEDSSTPAQPTGLVTAASESQVLLRWDDPEDDSITGYRVLRRSRDGDEYGDALGPAGFTVIAEDTGSAATSYTDGTVEAGTRYAYRVRAINAQGPGPESPDAYAATPEPTPDPKKEQQTVRATMDICSRTDAVETAILAASAVTSTDCSAVDDAELAKIATLRLANKSISSLQSGDFAGLTGLGTLGLANNDLTALPADVFNPLTSLNVLGLNDNNLASLPAGVFNSLTDLTQLELAINDLTELPDGVFNSLTSLTHLELADNDLTGLPDGVFNSLTSLTQLELDDNDLTGLPGGVFNSLTALETLSLHDNDLTELPDGVFDSLTSLTALELNDNDLTGLPDGVFDSLTALENLTLHNNDPDWPLPEAGDRVLLYLVSLTTYNNAAYTQPTTNICSRTQAVEEAILATSEVTSTDCTAVTLYELSRVTDLDLSNEVITALLAGDFAGLIGLTSLDLSDNFFIVLPEDLFEGLAALETLDLRDPAHAYDWRPPKLGDPVLRPLVSLTTYNSAPYTRTVDICSRTQAVQDAILARDEVTATGCEAVDAFELVEIAGLDLSGRSISALLAGDFAGLPGLTTLDLSDNDLSGLPEDVFEGLAALETLDLRGNDSGWTLPGSGHPVLQPLVSLTTYNGAAYICWRTSQVQTAILATSQVTSTDCAAGAKDELPEITSLDLSSQSISSPAAGRLRRPDGPDLPGPVGQLADPPAGESVRQPGRPDHPGPVAQRPDPPAGESVRQPGRPDHPGPVAQRT